MWLRALYYTGLYDENLYKELLKHTAATVGLPLAALAALCIVILLRSTTILRSPGLHFWMCLDV